jgi:hypothetical protein
MPHPPREEFLRMNLNAAKERRERIETFLRSPEWDLVAQGIARQRRATMERVALGVDLEERELRELQGRYRLMTDILTRPVEFLTQFDDRGDDR